MLARMPPTERCPASPLMPWASARARRSASIAGVSPRNVMFMFDRLPGCAAAPPPATVEEVVEQGGLAGVALAERGEPALVADPRDDLPDHVDAERVRRVVHRAVLDVGLVVGER